jgi:hypothetical protein
MKTARTIGLVILMVAMVAAMSLAQRPSKNNIVNSQHDLRAGFGGQPAYTLCNFCHVAHKTPNNSYPSNIGPLLWNHGLSAQTSYGVYSSDIFNSYGTDIADLGPLNAGAYTTSNTCLSCHDGTVAIASFYQPTGSVTNGQTFNGTEGATVNMYADKTIKDLTNTHPVNFTYYGASWIPQAGVLAPAALWSVDGAGVVPLENGKMQCWTCHDAHNGGRGPFLQNFPKTPSGTFCTYCHL